MTTAKTPYLILRICRPFNPLPDPTNWPVSARGYYLQNPDTRSAEETLARSGFIGTALHCDYMGSAEFEFGAVPKAFRQMARLAQKEELVEEEIAFTGFPNPCIAELPPHIKETTVKAWLYGPKDYLPFLKPILTEDLAKNDIPTKLRTKEIPYINEGLFGKIARDRKGKKVEHRESRFMAWFDLDNHWFLTTKKEHLEALKYLLGAPKP